MMKGGGDGGITGTSVVEISSEATRWSAMIG